MKRVENDFLDRIKAAVISQKPGAKIYLYGSRSRDDSTSDSDWDLLILLNKENISPEDERKILYPLYDIEFDSGAIISPMIYSEKEWNSKYKFTSFYESVKHDGILL